MLKQNISLIILLAVLVGFAEICYSKEPNMNITGNGVSIPDGDTTPSAADGTDFGTVDIGNTLDITYTITNSGNAGDLIFSGTPLVDIVGANPGDFSVTVDPATSIGKNGTTTFTVRFAPTADGLRQVTVSIETNHTDGRVTYTFAIQGTGNLSLTTPTVTTNTFVAASITANSATLGATITTDGGAAVTERGVVWNTSGSPTTGDNKVSQSGSWTAPPDVTYTVGASSLTAGSHIYFRGYAINTAGTAYVSSDSTFWTEPDSQASGVTFPVTGADSMTVSWSRGSGDGVIVLVKKDAPIDSPPVDGVDSYTASTDYSSPGTEIGSGNYVLYIGTGTSVAVSNLIPGGVYNIAVYEYAGSGSGASGINYLQSGAPTNSQLIVGPPSATTVSSSNVGQNTATLNITVASDGGGAITQHGTMFNITGPPITENQTTLGSYSGGVPGSFNDSVSGLPASSLIYFRGYVTNGDGTDYSDDGTFYTEPSTQATNLIFSGETESSVQIDWTGGNGSGSIVIVKADSTPDATPADGTVYTASTVFGDAGAEIGTSNYVAYVGTGASITLTNLAGGTTYYVAVYEYMGAGTGSSGINYRLSNAPTGNKKIIGYPNVTTPVVLTMPTTTDVTLQATINNDGGDPVTQRGFVWNTTGLPTLSDSNVSQNGSWAVSSPTPYSLSTGSLLTSATKYYFSGFATNPFGTTYTSDGVFYTEPGTQASGATFPSGDYDDIVLSVTRGDGDGIIVIAREGAAVNADPVDGVVYTAISNYGDPGSEIGTGNFVIYNGSATQAPVRNLTPSTTYHFAVYEYKGSGSGNGGINYKLVPATASRQTDPPPIGHNYENAIGCGTCHNSHGALVPRDEQQESSCIATCHYPGSPFSIYQDVAVHTGGHADCGSCHEPHSGDAAQAYMTSYDVHTDTTAVNASLIRGDDMAIFQPQAIVPAVFHPAADPNTFLAFGTFTPLPPANMQVEPWNGLCQTCHTSTSHHTNDNTGDHTHPDAALNPDNKGCLDCHPHSAGFAPVISEDTSCLDVNCHGGTNAGSLRNILAELDSGSHHLSATSSSAWGSVDRLIDEADCKVCHMEPDTGHMNGLIDLRDPDTGAALTGVVGINRNTGSSALEPDVLYVQDNFCMKCHDSDGASSTLSQNPASNGAMRPFANASQDVANVFDRFDTTLANFHPVRGTIASTRCTSTNMVAPWTGSGDLITCFDCHEANAHGGAYQRMLLDDINFDLITAANTEALADALTEAAAVDAFCCRCHDSVTYTSDRNPEDFGSAFGEHAGAIGQHGDFAGCYNCHAGLADFSGLGRSQGGAPGNTHGFAYQWTGTPQTETDGKWADAMVVGGYLDGLWSDTVGGDIYCAGPACNHATGRSSTYFP